jgi:hypothetical protein
MKIPKASGHLVAKIKWNTENDSSLLEQTVRLFSKYKGC